MKEETKRKWKTYAKILVPILLVFGFILYSVLTMNIQKLPKKADIAESDLAEQFAQAISDNSLLILDGEAEEADYEWFYGEGTITSDEDTDLSVFYTHEYDTFVMQYLQVNEVLGFYFADDIVLNGYPTLTLKLHDWKSEEVSLYRLGESKMTRLESQPVVNQDDEGQIEVTFQVNETDGIYYLAGGEHNLYLQGQGSASTEAVSEEKDTKEKADSQENQEADSQKKNDSEAQEQDKSTTEKTDNASQKNASDSSDLGDFVADVKPSGKESTLTAAIQRIYSDGTSTELDQYLTEPVPEGKPEPVEPEDVAINYKKSYTCTISIDCKTILEYDGEITEGKESYVPSDGWIMKKTNVLFYEGESVFDVLLRETQKQSIQMEYTMTPIYNSNYIEGIQNLYEFDCGSKSGWMYQVNGWYPNYGCSRYLLQEGDDIEWRYTCDYGFDLGCTLLAND